MTVDDPNNKVPVQRAPLSRQLGIAGIIAAIFMAFLLVFIQASRPSMNGNKSESGTSATAGETRVPPQGRQALHIVTEPARLAAGEFILRTTGQVVLPADRKTVVSPRLQGRVREVLVNVGQHVTAGQVIATMDSIDAAAAQTTARQAANRLRLAKDTLVRQQRLLALGTPDVAAAQALLDQARQHAAFTREALRRVRFQANIGGFTDKPFSDAQSDYLAAQSDLAQTQADQAQAQKERDRTQRLVEIGVAAKRDLDAAENTVQKAQLSVDTNKAKVGLAKRTLEREQQAHKTNLYADQQVRQAESDAQQAALQEQAADRTLRLAKAQVLRDVRQAESDYRSAQTDVENARNALALYGHPGPDGVVEIRAPMSGVVTERNVNPGQVVDQSQQTPWQMFTIINPGAVWIDADVYEKDLDGVRIGQRAWVTSDALPGYKAVGTLKYIAPGLDPKTHTIKIRTELANSEGRLKDGMFVNVDLSRPSRADRERSTDHVVIPIEAVQHDGDRPFVLVDEGGNGAGAAGRYQRRPVRLGAQQGDDLVIVSSGLRAGERVVTHGAIFLGDTGQGGD